jgi:hypothetical protein
MIPSISLLSPDGTPFDMEGHRLDRRAFELAELTHHRVEEMSARLTACKTVVEGRRKLPEFLQELFHIAGNNIKRGDGKSFACSPTGWQHTGPPGDTRGMQEEPTEWPRSCQR